MVQHITQLLPVALLPPGYFFTHIVVLPQTSPMKKIFRELINIL